MRGRRRVLLALKARTTKSLVDPKRVAKLQREVESRVDAIASGALAASPALAARLQASEAELERLKAETVLPAPK